MRFGTRSVRNLYSSDSLTAAAREVSRYKLDFVGVQEVRWKKGGTVRVGAYILLFLRKRKRKSPIGNRIFCTPHNSVSS